eukprot:41105-Prorocentrum_minimum.AAC.1
MTVLGLDTDTAELTVKTLSSHLVTLKRIQFSRQFFTDVECPCGALQVQSAGGSCNRHCYGGGGGDGGGGSGGGDPPGRR